MPLKDYTTVVPVHQSIAEITKALVKAGARGVAQEYAADGSVAGLQFAIPHHDQMLRYDLPVSAGAVGQVLTRQRVAAKYTRREHVERVAWRIMRDWVLAQLAILETNMVSLPQVMLPYLVGDNGHTLYQQWENSFRALPAGER
jgi:hypothetical protein